MIKVMLVAGQRLSREGVGRIISAESDMDVVGLASDEEEALRLMKNNVPDIVLIDIHMRAVDGIKTMTQMIDLYPSVKVILITNFDEEDLVFSGILNGAHGFLSKKIDAEHLIQSIRNVYDDQMVISGQAAQILADTVLETKYNHKQILGRKLKSRGIHLTERELDVAYLIMKETPNLKVAEELHISEGTAKNYISDLYSKIHLNRRRDVIRYLRNLFPKYE